jgi:SHS family lactate transporter-like MFS transporter
VGALIFGTVADRYGRKWPMIINLCFFIVLELGTGFCQTLSQFLAVRSLYGIAMGGLFGPAAATALEDLPYDARGILSGLFEQGYATGYLLAAIFYRALVPTHGWRSLFWFGAGPPILIILFRWSLPETNAFQVHQAERIAKHQMSQEESDGTDVPKVSALRAFAREFRSAFTKNVSSTLYSLYCSSWADETRSVVLDHLYGGPHVRI